MKVLLSLSILLLYSIPVFSQNLYDAQWLIGYDTSSTEPGGNAILMDFRNDGLNISNVSSVENIEMAASNTSMCDKSGNLLFYSNGCYIVNAAHEIMKNGDGINPGVIQDIYCPGGFNPIPQGAIALPQPEHSDVFYLFNIDMQYDIHESPDLSIAPLHLFYQVIDMSKDNGLGELIHKNQIGVQDTLGRGMLTATKHTNNRDWWVVMPESHSNCYYLLLLTSQGLQNPIKKCEGFIWDDDDSGSAVFSPDGTKYIRFNYQNGLNIMDFNASNGTFNNPIQIDFPDDAFPTSSGASISPNSRFLYTSAKKNLYQFDLEASNIEDSKVLVAEWDGFSNPSPIIFNTSTLGPDGKIYISSTSTHLNLHVINKPNCKGLDSEVVQHGIELPSWNFSSIPNLPYYAKDEIYECDSTVNTVSVFMNQEEINIYPNPASDKVNITLKNGILKKTNMYSMTGELLNTYIMTGDKHILNIGILPSGIYLFEIETQSGRRYWRKVVVE